MPAGTKYPEADSEWDKLHEKCFVLAAAFVGVTRSALTAGVSSWIESESRWLRRRSVDPLLPVAGRKDDVGVGQREPRPGHSFLRK